jgi:hypothetical protein
MSLAYLILYSTIYFYAIVKATGAYSFQGCNVLTLNNTALNNIRSNCNSTTGLFASCQ